MEEILSTITSDMFITNNTELHSVPAVHITEYTETSRLLS